MTALGAGQPDRVPVFDVIDECIIEAVADILGIDSEEKGDRESWDRYCLVVERLGLDATLCGVSKGMQPLGDGLVKDKYGCTYRTSEHGEPIVVSGPINSDSDLVDYDLLSRLEDEDFSRCEYLLGRLGSDKAHLVAISDPFKTSWLLRGGMEKLLLDYYENPSLVHALARVATDLNLAVIDHAAQMGADALFMGGDLAGEQTTLMSPSHYREYIKPYHAELVSHAHRVGLKFVKHTDGNLWPIIDDFMEVGFDGFHPVQPQCMDIAEVKRYVAGRLCLLGNIDCRDLLPFGTEEEVERSVEETIARAGPGGGYILCSSNSIHPAVKPENFIAMVRAAKRYGAYE